MGERTNTDREKDLKAYQEHRENRRMARSIVETFSHDRLHAEIEVMLQSRKGTKRAGLSRYAYLDILFDERDRRLQEQFIAGWERIEAKEQQQ